MGYDVIGWGPAVSKRVRVEEVKTKYSVTFCYSCYFHTTGSTDDYVNGTCKVFLKYAFTLMRIIISSASLWLSGSYCLEWG